MSRAHWLKPFAKRKFYSPIIDLADLTINTTHLNLYQLRDIIKLRLLDKPEPGTAFLIESFGFKRGVPVDADVVFDIRCLPNPYWKPELRAYCGLDQPIVDYLASKMTWRICTTIFMHI